MLKLARLQSVQQDCTCIEKQSIKQIPASRIYWKLTMGEQPKTACQRRQGNEISQRNEIFLRKCPPHQNKTSHILQPSLNQLKGSGHPTLNLTKEKIAIKSKNDLEWGVHKGEVYSTCWVSITSLKSFGEVYNAYWSSAWIPPWDSAFQKSHSLWYSQSLARYPAHKKCTMFMKLNHKLSFALHFNLSLIFYSSMKSVPF